MSLLTNADIIFYNGLHLEGKMGDVLHKIGERKPVVPVAEAIDEERLRHPPQFAGNPDPHVWFDVSMWMRAAEATRDALMKFDQAHAEDYRKNAVAYLAKLKDLHEYAKTQLATVPRERRVLVTAHDAFSYFGGAYDVEVQGLQGISTASEYSVKDVQRLVALISKRGIKAVFVESSVPRRSIEAVVQGCKAKGHEVVIGGELFSDAMGRAGTPEGTYIGMVRHNVDTIVKALK
jgi:manganese/zinc/iron transport system substrate-binding protein